MRIETIAVQLVGGIGALAVASGMAAIAYAIQTIAETGDNIVASSALYGGTYNLFAHTFPQQGIELRFADPRDPAAFASLIDARTKAVFCESIGNPLGNVTDIAALADVAHAAGVPLIVDSTVSSPYLCRPFEHGADIVVHALTKYLGGHGTTPWRAGVAGLFMGQAHRQRTFTRQPPTAAVGPGLLVKLAARPMFIVMVCYKKKSDYGAELFGAIRKNMRSAGCRASHRGACHARSRAQGQHRPGQLFRRL